MIIVRYLVNVLLSVDQLLNSILLGHPDETLSSRLGRTTHENHRYFWVKWFRIFVDCMFFFDVEKDEEYNVVIRHCEKSIMPLEQLNFRNNSDYEIWCWNKNDITIDIEEDIHAYNSYNSN